MSGGGWVASLLRGLLILTVIIASCTGNSDDCSLCCFLQGHREDLNCTWRRSSTLPHTVQLRHNNHVQHMTVQPSQDWLLIPRESLTSSNHYQLTVNGGTRTETLDFKFCNGCKNVLFSPPGLASSVSEDNKLEVTWDHSKHDGLQEPLPVELKYRKLGDVQWIPVHQDDQQNDSFELTDSEPYTEYEFQIRYIPVDKKAGSLWSESYKFSTPEEAPIGTLDIWRNLNTENSLLVMWKPLSPDCARGKILGYIGTYVHNQLLHTFEEPCCNTTLPVNSTQVCVLARNSKGLGNQTCMTLLYSVAADSDEISGEAWGDRRGNILVWWKEPVKSDQSLTYVVEWREDGNQDINWIRSHAANQTVTLRGDFFPGVQYLISVYSLDNDNCLQIFSTEAYSQEEVPIAAPNISTQVISSTEADISWEEIPRQHLRGKLTNYTIYVSGITRAERHKDIVNAQTRNSTLRGLSPETLYTVEMTASTAAGEGPRSAPKNIHTMSPQRLSPWVVPVLCVLGLCGVMASVLVYPRTRRILHEVFWPKIPNPEYKLNGAAISFKVWAIQADPNPPITDVEEMETLPPPSPPPDRSRAVPFGYEKHFMPTPEEVEGLCRAIFQPDCPISIQSYQNIVG